MKSVLLISFMLMCGCMPVFPTTTTMTPAPQIREQIFTPAIGEVKESPVGDPMIMRQDANVSMGYVAIKNLVIPASDHVVFPIIQIDSKWKVIGAENLGRLVIKNDLYMARSLYVVGSMCFIINPVGDIVGHTWCDSRSPSEIYPQVWGYPSIGVFEVQGKYYEPGSFRQELVYNGKGGNVIKLSYREYNNDMVRPAFTQDLSYDLSEGKTIGFRGMNIDVLNATNFGIKFVVKSPMK